MNIKKLSAVLIAAILLLAIVGCANNAENATDNANSNKNKEEVLTYEDLTYAVNLDGTYEITGYTYGGTEPKAVVIPERIDGRNVTGIKAEAFKPHKTLTAITIPATITYIGDYAFYDCDALESVVIPNSVKSIGKGAFQSCNGLKSVTLPAGLTEIAKYTFLDCTSLDGVIIPETVASIGDSAFRNCASLKEITIPASVKDIGNTAFYECKSLTKATVIGNALGATEVTEDGKEIPHTIGEMVFHGCYTELDKITLVITVNLDAPFAKYLAKYESIGSKLGSYKVTYLDKQGAPTDGPNADHDNGDNGGNGGNGGSGSGNPADDNSWTEIA